MIINFKKNKKLLLAHLPKKIFIKKIITNIYLFIKKPIINFLIFLFSFLRDQIRKNYPNLFLYIKNLKFLNLFKNYLYSAAYGKFINKEEMLQKNFEYFEILKILNVSLLKKILIELEKNNFKQEKIDVSIIIPVYGQLKYSLECLISILLSNQGQLSLEIIIINDKPDCAEYKFLSKFRNIKYIVNNKNLGFVKSCNQGSILAKGKYLYFLNNDTFVTNFTIFNLYNTFAFNNNIGLVGSKLLYPNYLVLQEAGSLIFSDGGAYNFGKYNSSLESQYNFFREVDYCSGCSIMVNKNLFFEVGKFDTLYAPAYYEDVDLCFKVRSKNLKCVYQPTSLIIHHEGISSGKDLNTGIKKFQLVNQNHFYNKWKNILKKHSDNKNSQLGVIKQFNFYFSKKILIIDEIMCKPNLDAGSYYMFNFMKFLIKKNCKVSFLTRFSNISERYYLNQHGIETPTVGVDTNSLESFLTKKIFEYDTVILTRPLMFDFYFPIIKKLKFKGKIIYNTIDLHFLRYEREYELSKNKNLLILSRKLKKLELNAINKTDKTLVFGNPDKKYLIQNKFVNKSKLLNFPVIQEINNHNINSNKKNSIIFIGNFNHQPNIDALNNFIENIFYLNNTNLKLIIIGKNGKEKIKLKSKKNIIFAGYVKDITKYFKEAFFSIAPLRFGAGLNGKVLLSMSYGLPVIGTEYIKNSLDLTDMKNFIICEKRLDFEKKIKYMKKNRNIYQKLVKNCLKYINENYSSKNYKDTNTYILKS